MFKHFMSQVYDVHEVFANAGLLHLMVTTLIPIVERRLVGRPH